MFCPRQGPRGSCGHYLSGGGGGGGESLDSWHDRRGISHNSCPYRLDRTQEKMRSWSLAVEIKLRTEFVLFRGMIAAGIRFAKIPWMSVHCSQKRLRKWESLPQSCFRAQQWTTKQILLVFNFMEIIKNGNEELLNFSPPFPPYFLTPYLRCYIWACAVSKTFLHTPWHSYR